MLNLLGHSNTLLLRLSLGNTSSGVLPIEQDGDLFQCRASGFDEEKVNDKTLDNQAVEFDQLLLQSCRRPIITYTAM